MFADGLENPPNTQKNLYNKSTTTKENKQN